VRLGEECVAVGRAEGARLPDGLADEIAADLARMPPDLGTSMLFDREAGRELEWQVRNGVIQRLGAKHRIATPVSDVIVPLLAAASARD
jgi:2-dehydropantoate 2-reductase